MRKVSRIFQVIEPPRGARTRLALIPANRRAGLPTCDAGSHSTDVDRALPLPLTGRSAGPLVVCLVESWSAIYPPSLCAVLMGICAGDFLRDRLCKVRRWPNASNASSREGLKSSLIRSGGVLAQAFATRAGPPPSRIKRDRHMRKTVCPDRPCTSRRVCGGLPPREPDAGVSPVTLA